VDKRELIKALMPYVVARLGAERKSRGPSVRETGPHFPCAPMTGLRIVDYAGLRARLAFGCR